MQIKLDAAELAELRKPVRGGGGFQGMLTALRQRAAVAGKLDLAPDEIARIRHYAFGYGNGGFEGRLRVIFERHLGPNLDGLG